MPVVNRGRRIFPSPEKARYDGLLAYGGDLEIDTLVQAYANGIFPWYSAGDPILWWCPDPRCVLFLPDFNISRRSLRKMRNSGFSFSFDAAFDEVVEQCAGPRKEETGTWILPEMRLAYGRMHRAGHAHSVEIWQNGALVGGLYGVALGSVFFGESMFHHACEASRAALLCLSVFLEHNDFRLVDCQQPSPHILAMGAREIPRKIFLEELAFAISEIRPGSWRDWPASVKEINGILPCG